MAKPRCTGTTKAGQPCQASPLKDGNYCRAHDPELPASARFGSRAQATAAGKLGGRPKAPRVVDILKERFEAEADEWLGALKDALQAHEAVTVGFGKDAYLEMVPDHRTRLQALSIAFDRVYGRPKQQTELTGADGGPLEIVTPVTRPGGVHSLIGSGVLPVRSMVTNGNGNGNGNGHH